MNFPFQPQGPSTLLATGAASANSAMPQLGDNSTPRYMRVIATGRCAIAFGGDNTVSTTYNTGIRLAANVPEIIATAGQKYVAYIDGADATVGISMTPVELAVPR